MLYETATALQQAVFSNAAEAAGIIEKIETVVTAFEQHAHTEDHFVFAAIAAYEPATVAVFEQEHEEDHALGLQLQNWLTQFGCAESPIAKQSIGEELVKSFIQFMVFNLKHMAKEEDIINKLLWRYYTDAELKQITKEITSRIPPHLMMMYSRWMIKGMSNTEITCWLKEIKNSAPEPVWGALLALTEQELPANRWSLVGEALTEGAMVA